MQHEAPPIETVADREPVLTRLIDAPRAKIFRCRTEPKLITQWFTPPRGVATDQLAALVQKA